MPVAISATNDLTYGFISYVYDANGNKLEKKLEDYGNNSYITTQYAGDYVYENNSLKQISHPEGYLELDGNGGYQYVYRLNDIWGNTRITFADGDDDGKIDLVRNDTDIDGDGDLAHEIRREQNFYPFGMQHKGYNNTLRGVKNNLKTYQGQEFTEDLGLNTHEWKYRVSDPSIGRFWQIDPLAEDYMYNSTYAFQENKMGMGVELEGRELFGWDMIAAVDAAINPNGVGAHAIGVTEGVVSSVQGTIDAISSPVQTAQGVGNLLLASALKGDPAMMAQADAALGTNSTGAANGLATSIENGVNDLINGNGVERGNVIGQIGMAVVGGKGTNAAVKATTTALKSTKAGATATKLIGPIGDAGASVTRQVPGNFIMKSAKKGAGTRFSDPNGPPGSNSVRVMRGNPNSPNPSQQIDYVKHTKNGRSVDVNGNPAASNSPAAHIPKKDFNINN